jgi:hypothetical protein
MMPRLLPGQDTKIDRINELVAISRLKNGDESSQAMQQLLQYFHPMILKICKYWSGYFNDNEHVLKIWDVIVCEAQSWFVEYTLEIYIPDGRATYNKFIKDHVSQRVRYMFECELKYRRHHIFPDPDKHEGDLQSEYCSDALEDVIHKYAKINNDDISIDDEIIENEDKEYKNSLVKAILSKIDDVRYFTEREKKVFMECIYKGRTHDVVGVELGVSRTRVSQMVCKIKEKMRYLIYSDGINRRSYNE